MKQEYWSFSGQIPRRSGSYLVTPRFRLTCEECGQTLDGFSIGMMFPMFKEENASNP